MATESYLTVTFHYLNEQWKIKSVISGTLPLSESHTAINIVAWIKELVDESGIGSDKVVAFIHVRISKCREYTGRRTCVAFSGMCRTYITALCEFRVRDTSYKPCYWCRATSDYPFSEEHISSVCFKNTPAGHENGTTLTYTRCKHTLE